MPRIVNEDYDVEKRICVVCHERHSVSIPKGDPNHKAKQRYREAQYRSLGWTQDWFGGNLCADCGKERAARMRRQGEYVLGLAIGLAVGGVVMLAMWGV